MRGGWNVTLYLTLNQYDWKELEIEGDGKGTISRGSIDYLRMNYCPFFWSTSLFREHSLKVALLATSSEFLTSQVENVKK